MKPRYKRLEGKYEIITETGCWIWVGAMKEGYGYVMEGRKTYRAYKVAYEHYKGEVPPGLELDHICIIKDCINPDHLEAVTHKVNVLRGKGLAAQNSRKTMCQRGHSYSESNTYQWKNKRYCRMCRIYKSVGL